MEQRVPMNHQRAQQRGSRCEHSRFVLEYNRHVSSLWTVRDHPNYWFGRYPAWHTALRTRSTTPQHGLQRLQPLDYSTLKVIAPIVDLSYPTSPFQSSIGPPRLVSLSKRHLLYFTSLLTPISGLTLTVSLSLYTYALVLANASPFLFPPSPTSHSLDSGYPYPPSPSPSKGPGQPPFHRPPFSTKQTQTTQKHILNPPYRRHLTQQR